MQEDMAGFEGRVLDPSDRIREVVPGVRMLGGGPKPHEMPPLFAASIGRRLPNQWTEVAELQVADLLEFPGVGEIKVKRFLEYLDGLADGPPLGPTAQQSGILAIAASTARQADRILETIITNGIERDDPDVLTAIEMALGPEGPGQVRDQLSEILLPRIGVGEWIEDLESIRSSIDGRSIEILEGRVLMESRREPMTLQELADGYGVTRERVRQLENSAVKSLVGRASESKFLGLRHARRRVADLGIAFPVASLGFPEDRADLRRVLLWLTGPYRIDAGWAVREEYEGLPGVARAAFNEAATDGIALHFDYVEAVFELGVSRDRVETVAASLELERIDDYSLLPAPSIGERAAQRLRVSGQPMSMAELFEGERGDRNQRSFATAVQASPLIVRTGKDRYALPEWGGTEYPKILPAMVDRLGKHGQRPIAELAAELEAEYGVAQTSVHMYATMHPKFLAESGLVRVRPADVPYEPKEALPASAYCYLVEGAWAVRLPVDRELLRGSGRWIPEAFAVHLGIQPLEKGQLHGPVGEIRTGWDMSPYLGSLRREATRLGLEVGDFLLICRTTPTDLDLRAVLHRSLDGANHEQQVKLLVGADADDHRRWSMVLAEAIGIGAATDPDPEDLLGRLRHRGDADLVDLVEVLIDQA